MCMCHTVAQCMNVLKNVCELSCVSKKPMCQRKDMCLVLNDNRLSSYLGQPSKWCVC